METVEDIILRYSKRGMPVLREHLPADYCTRAARTLLSLKRGTVLLTTGFYVYGRAETDGPAGTFAVARALKRLGFIPVIVTDRFCRGLFEPSGYETVYFPLDGNVRDAESILERYAPVALFSLERCGLNAEGHYANMHNVPIDAWTAPTDLLFRIGEGWLATVAVGDGGNEIGMGTLRDVIKAELDVVPCIVPAEHLIVSTVSNWGGYGLCAALGRLTGEDLVPTPETIRAFMREAAGTGGCLDGVTGETALTEDGFSPAVSERILRALRAAQTGAKE